MDSVEVQEFLMTTAANNQDDALICPEVEISDTSSSMYFSINDDTLSNRLVDDLQQLEKTLTVIEEDEDSSQQKSEMNSVINNNLELTTKDEEFFQKNLQLKLFPNQRSQCSTPKIESIKTPQVQVVRDPLGDEISVPVLPELKLDGCLIPDLVLPLTTVLQKLEKKVTIVDEKVEESNKENRGPVAGRANLRKSLKPRDGLQQKTVIPAKKPTLRKSMIPNAPSMAAPSGKVAAQPVNPSSLAASRKSVRLSVVPSMLKSSRFTIGGASRVAKVNSPTLAKKSPRTKRRSILPPKTAAQRMTINATAAKEPATATSSTALAKIAETQPPKKPEVDPAEQAKKRMSRIPQFPAKSTDNQQPSTIPPPRPDFTCNVCKKSFHLKSTLLTHQKIHSAKSAAASGHFKCTFCDKDFEKEVGLRNHVERYCEKVPVAEKRKLNASHNRTNSVEIKDRSKKDKSSSSRHESTSSSVGSSQGEQSSSLQVPMKKEQQTHNSGHNHPGPPPASGLSPRKPIKSISHPHSGIKFSANKPIKCYHCQITFNNYVDFHSHVDKMHPTVQSPKEKEVKEEKEVVEGQ